LGHALKGELGGDVLVVQYNVTQAGLSIRNPVEFAQILFEASESACEETVESLKNGTELNLAEHCRKVHGASKLARDMRKMDDVAANDARTRERGIRVKN
jgi:hypothetical protein